ncbi:MAG TPA: hypothetical protein VN445_11130 [Rectinemataceae bacterium]|nr:hypothetical protein [Rectinemataceae bacterium]
MKIHRPADTPWAKKRPLPLSLTLTIFVCAVGFLSAYSRRTASFSIAFGDALMIGATAMFGLAWFGYLKKDGVRVFPPKKSAGAKGAESWADRVPGLGDPPFPPPPAPGPEGPDSEAYKRLADAEERLRKKIVGFDREEKKAEGIPTKNQDFTKSTALSGFFLLILALCFEYCIPALLR